MDDKEHARRVAAALRICEGIETELLEQCESGVLLMLIDLYNNVKAARGEK